MTQSIPPFHQKNLFKIPHLADLNIDDNSPFPLKVPDDFMQQMDVSDPNDPLLKQILPLKIENQIAMGFSTDPVQDLDFTPSPSLIHKYHGRVLLIASPKCDIHCRYCFRRHFPYATHSNTRHWQKALEYIQQDHSIHEVILSGGDPMSLSEHSLVRLIQKIEAIPHIQTLRIHSRTPIVAPSQAPTTELIAWAKSSRLNKVLVVHCNHANELSTQTATLFSLYKAAGFHLLNQSVLLKGINDQVNLLETLSHALFKQGVLPYYLNQLDRVQGAMHFEVDHTTAVQIHTKLRKKLPGYLLPQLVQDIQGKPYKTPLRSF
ncbi:Lysine 2,3-aminomutase [hydrothermal vent metagenome]|uniref:L-lysine 2,3-aminomutase n=1 Tax=hydrothermal vent metagenome TaxID=652676 RepID=A0A3B0VWN3_9ZZZZ